MKKGWKLSAARRGAFGALTAALLWNCAGAAVKSAPEAGAPKKPAEQNAKIVEGEGRGFRGNVRIAVTLDGDSILGIEILDHEDDPFIGGAAMEELLELALEGEEVDIIAGATESSAGFLSALEDAMERAEEP